MTEHLPHPHTPEQERLLSTSAIGSRVESSPWSEARPSWSARADDLPEEGGRAAVMATFRHQTKTEKGSGPREHLRGTRRRNRRPTPTSRRSNALRLCEEHLADQCDALTSRATRHELGEKRARRKNQRLGKSILGGRHSFGRRPSRKPLDPRHRGGDVLTASGLQLLTYREPEGAFEREDLELGGHPATEPRT